MNEWPALILQNYRKQFRPFFLGASDGVLHKMIFNLRKEFSKLQIAGWHDGYFAPQEDGRLVQQIRRSGGNCLFLGLPTPRKERLLARYKDEFGVPFVMGVGGLFAVLAGGANRVPLCDMLCSGGDIGGARG